MGSIRVLFGVYLFTFINYATAGCPAVDKCLSAGECGLLPVPDKSHTPPVRPVGYNVTQLRSGVYSYTNNVYMSIVVYKDHRLTLIDFPVSDAAFQGDEYLLNSATVEILGRERPTHLDMVYGHRHLDHIGGAPIFLSFIQSKFPELKTFVWGTSETREYLGRDPMSRIPKINVIVGDKGGTVKVAKTLKVKLVMLGGHTNSDMVAHIPPSSDGQGIAHFADIITPGFAPFQSFGFTIDLYSYIKAHEKLLKFNFKLFSPGHGKIAGKKDIRRNLLYTRDVIKYITEAVNETTPKMLTNAGLGRIGDPTAVEFNNFLLGLKIRADVSSKLCVRKLIKKYGCELANVGVFGPSHCVTAFFLGFADTVQV